MKKTVKPLDPSDHAVVVPKDQRHRVPKEALEPRYTKVRVTMYLDLDVLNFFKRQAEKQGASAYQTQINAALREIVERAEDTGKNPAVDLRQAKGLIDAALRKIS